MTDSQDTKQTPGTGDGPTNNHLWNQLGNAVSLDGSVNQVTWNIFGLFWAADTILLGALFTAGDIPKPAVGTLVSIAGAVLSAIWYILQKRAIGGLRFYEGVVERLEKALSVPDELALSRKINTTLWNSCLTGTVSIRPLMKVFPALSGVLWILALFWFGSV